MHRSGLIPNQTRVSKRSRAHAYTSRLVSVPADYNFHTKVQLKGSKVRLAWKERCKSCSLQARWPVDWCTHDRLRTFVWFGIRAERCIAASSDQNQSTQHPKDYNIWTNHGHLCFYKSTSALFSDILVTYPHLVGRSHPILAEVQEVDWE